MGLNVTKASVFFSFWSEIMTPKTHQIQTALICLLIKAAKINQCMDAISTLLTCLVCVECVMCITRAHAHES